MPELADTSVWAVRRHPRVRAWFEDRMAANEIATCDQIKLELLHGTRSRTEFRELRSNLEALPLCPMLQPEWDRVLDVYERLAAMKPLWHRSVKHADLIIAACAESAGMTLVHYDQDYDAITRVTGQPTRWVVPRGSI